MVEQIRRRHSSHRRSTVGAKSTGPNTEEGKQRSRCNAVRHGLTAETVIGAKMRKIIKHSKRLLLRITMPNRPWSGELVLRLASLLWRLRRATTMETGLFEIQADHLREFRRGRHLNRSRRKLSVQGSGVLILSMPSSIEHRSKLQMERKPCPARGGNALIPPSTLHIAFCVWPICPVTRSTGSAAMKQSFGVRSAKSCLRSIRRKPRERHRFSLAHASLIERDDDQ
jgi:hypothetical protein